MPATSLKEKTAKGLLWGGIGNGAMQLLNLAFGIFLARLLTDTDYGMVAVLTIFSATASIFADSGFVTAIVNKKTVKDEDYNAVFWFSLCMGIALYALLFACAPLIARFFEVPELCPLARLLFLGFLFGSCSTAPSAYLFRNLMVKERSQIQITAIILSGITGVTLAYFGFGYWGIALQTLLYAGSNTLLLWLRCPWRPNRRFRSAPLREMLPFSLKIFFTTLFTHINNNILSLLIGKLYTIAQAGYYSQGSKWTTMGYSTIYGMINSVGQPVFREAYADTERLRNIFRKMLRFTAFIAFPAMLGLGIIARELITITITEKWLPCVPVMQVLCVWGAFMPIAALYTNLMNSIGRPHIYMWNTMALGVVQLLLVCFSHPLGIHTMLVVYTVANVLWLGIWHYFGHKHIGLPIFSLLKDIAPYMLLSVSVLGIAWYAASFFTNVYVTLCVKIVVAAALYTSALWQLKSKIFEESVRFLFKRNNPLL